MTEAATSGIQQAQATTKSQLYDIALRVAFPVLLGVSAWTFTQLWSHEGRLVVLETRSEGVKEDLQEIKADLKKLLGGH